MESVIQISIQIVSINTESRRSGTPRLNNKMRSKSRDPRNFTGCRRDRLRGRETRRIARRSEYFPASVRGEARDSSTVTLIRARFKRRIRGTRVILVPTNPLPRARFLPFLPPPWLSHRGWLDAALWIPCPGTTWYHTCLSADRSLSPPPSNREIVFLASW